jgi:hypothetical protein
MNSIKTTSAYILKDNNWEKHVLEFIADFKAVKDPKMVLHRPLGNLNRNHTALLASIVCSLCEQYKLITPSWAKEIQIMKNPWTITGIQALHDISNGKLYRHFKRNKIELPGYFKVKA